MDDALSLLYRQPSQVLWKIGHLLIDLTKRDFLSNLPVEIALEILSFTDAQTVCKISRLSKIHHDLCLDNSLWRILFFRKGYKVDSEYLLSSLQELYNVKKVQDTLALDVVIDHCVSNDITYGTLPRDFIHNNQQVDTEFQPLQVVKSSKKEFIGILHENLLTLHDAVVDWKWIFRHRMQLERNWKWAHRFDHLTGQFISQGYRTFEFMGHEEAVYCLQFDRDKIVSGSRDGKIKS